MLELKHISKKFQDRIILDDISIVFPDTGMIGIQGESGCGKSTLLYVIGMLDKDYQGDIFYNGEIIVDRPAFIRQNISYMMQSKDMISALTLKENIILPCQVSHVFYDMNQLKKITSQLEIDSLLSRYPTQLSGGQLKRASIAKALLKQSSIILADEPTGALHSSQAHVVMEQLQKLSQNSLVIVVSHDLDLLNQYCEHVLTLQNGQLKGRMKKKKSLPIHHQKYHHSSLIHYPIKQLLHQRNKLVFLFLFQWIVIVSFFCIVTAMNGVFEAIEESEWQSVHANTMTIEKRDGTAFQEFINNTFIHYVQYASYLEQLSLTNDSQSLSCMVHHLPQQTNHIPLQQGRLPQSAYEILVSHSLYQSIKSKEIIQFTYQQQVFDMKIVGVIADSFFDSEDIYCFSSFGESLQNFTNSHVLEIEAKTKKARELYEQLSKEYNVYSDVIERVENYQSILTLARFIAYIFIGVSFVISLLLIAIVESIIYLERKHDVAYLLSLGMSKKRLFFLSFMEALFMGMMMGLGGCLLSMLVYFYVNDVYQIAQHIHIRLVLKKIIVTPFDLYIFLIIVYMFMTMIGSLVPMKRMMKTDMIDVLREE